MRLDRDDFTIIYDTSKVGEDKIVTAVKESGYMATIKEPGYAFTIETGRIGRSVDGLRGPSEKLPSILVEALVTAKREHKPVVLDFYAEWCVPCKRMLRETFGDSKVERLLQECIVIKIDTDRYPELARKFGVEGLPDIRFLAEDGSERKRLLDYQDAASFAKALAELVSTSGDRGKR
jgi:thiol:disulfide interchange protein DsbD